MATNFTTYTGTPEDDFLVADIGSNLISGLEGNDAIRGAEEGSGQEGDLLGNDTISGGDGDDEIFADSLPAHVTLWGVGGHDLIRGDAGNDTVHGDRGSDEIHGGSGHDQLYGAGGVGAFGGMPQSEPDTYAGHNIFDGNDTLFGGAGNDTLRGQAGDDSLAGGIQHDFLAGGAGHDALDGGDGDDYLIGDSGNDTLQGGHGHDTLTGGEGVNVLTGGLGRDVFFVDADDVITDFVDGEDLQLAVREFVPTWENFTGMRAYGGDDPVNIFADLAVRPATESPQENILLGSTGGDWYDGGASDDWLDGRMGNDTLIGGGGNDTVIGGDGADVLSGGSGADHFIADAEDTIVDFVEGEDTIEYIASVPKEQLAGTAEADLLQSTPGAQWQIAGGAGNDTLLGGSGRETLLGGTGDDKLSAAGGHDRLDGGTGNDTLKGGFGDDTYVIDGASDVVMETADGGVDTLISDVSRTLGSNFERLVLAGNAANGNGNGHDNTLIGNALDNRLRGLDGYDLLSGGAGNDTLIGGADSDMLEGGAGSDRFVFDELEARNFISDFETGIDRLALKASVFTGLVRGALDESALQTGTTALDADDRILYDIASGTVYYDADGTGSTGKVYFAVLLNNANITAADFLVL